MVDSRKRPVTHTIPGPPGSIEGADRPRRNRDRRRAAVLLTLMIAQVACASKSDEHSPFMTERDPVTVADVIATGATPPANGVPIYRANAVILTSDEVWVADGGGDRIVVLGRDLTWRRAFGRSGAGPGEMKTPFAAASGAGLVAVSDFGNGRVSTFDEAGRYVGEIRTGVVTSIAIGQDGAIYTPVAGTDHLVTRWQGGSSRVLAPRPAPLQVPTNARGAQPSRRGLLAVTAGDTIHVLDPDEGVLYKFTPDGALVLSRELPASLVDSLRTKRNLRTRSFAKQQLHVLSWPIVKGMARTPDDHLLLLVTSGRTFGLVVDPTDYDATRLVVGDDPVLADALLRARSAAMDGDRLYVLSADSVLALAVPPQE